MDPAAVAAYYRAKGYVVRDGARVSGPSGTEYKVPLMAEGPLGSLAVFFGDFGGVDGPEMGGARKVAREIGATPVLAADAFTSQDRQVAARLGVVLLDAATVAGEGPPTAAQGLGADTGRAWPGLAPIPTRLAKKAEAEAEPHPWPASGRVGGRDGPATRAVDVDEILAGPRGTPAAPTAPTSPTPQVLPDAAAEAKAGTPIASSPGNDREAEQLWKRPRSPTTTAAAARPPRAPGSRRFAWLGADVPQAPGERGPLAVEYDDAVPAAAADTEAGAPDERLGDSIELAAPMEELERKARHDRLLRRLFWILFASVLLYLFTVWWF